MTQSRFSKWFYGSWTPPPSQAITPEQYDPIAHFDHVSQLHAAYPYSTQDACIAFLQKKYNTACAVADKYPADDEVGVMLITALFYILQEEGVFCPELPDPRSFSDAYKNLIRSELLEEEAFYAKADDVLLFTERAVLEFFEGFLSLLPSSAFNPPDVPLATIPLLNAVDHGAFADLIVHSAKPPYDGLPRFFDRFRRKSGENVCRMARLADDAKQPQVTRAIEQLEADGRVLDIYISDTPLEKFLSVIDIPWELPQEQRFSGHWIIAPPGRGKTTLLHAMFLNDLPREASIIVMDSKGDLINPIKKLQAVQDRLVLIEPDADYPLALNPLDIPKTNIAHTVSLLEYIFSALLEAKMTALQQTLFRSVLPAIVEAIPDATLDTFRDIIENGIEPYREHLDRLPPSLKQFFDRDFNTKTYSETRAQLVWRLQFLMTNPVIKQMFSAWKTRLDIGREMDAGKIILVDNSKKLLGEEGSEFFGRFFIALVLAAAQQREGKHHLPCFFYIDECQSVIYRDEKIPTILDECRSKRVALILAHQRTAQIKSPNVLDALANCAIRMANSDDEAKYLADKLRMSVDAIRSLPRGTFGTYIRDYGPISLSIPYNDLSTHPQISPDEEAALRQRMREEYSFTYEPPRPRKEPSPKPPPKTEAKPTEKDTLQRIYSGLLHLQKGIAPFVELHMRNAYGSDWMKYTSRADGSPPEAPLDAYGLIKTMLDKWREIFDPVFDRNTRHKARNFTSTAFEARNVIAHFSGDIEDNDALRYLDAMYQLLRLTDASETETEELNALYEAQRTDGLPTKEPPRKQEPQNQKDHSKPSSDWS